MNLFINVLRFVHALVSIGDHSAAAAGIFWVNLAGNLFGESGRELDTTKRTTLCYPALLHCDPTEGIAFCVHIVVNVTSCVFRVCLVFSVKIIVNSLNCNMINLTF